MAGNKRVGVYKVDVEVQPDGKFDVWIDDGGPGYNYVVDNIESICRLLENDIRKSLKICS